MLHFFYILCVQMNSDLRRRKVTVRKGEQRGAFVIIEVDLICPCSFVIYWRRGQRISDEHRFLREFRGQFFNSGFRAVCVCTCVSSIHCPCVRVHQYSISTHTGPARPLVPNRFSHKKTSLASLHTFCLKTFMGMKEIVLLVRTQENVILRHQLQRSKSKRFERKSANLFVQLKLCKLVIRDHSPLKSFESSIRCRIHESSIFDFLRTSGRSPA